jgi:phage anti-repressor protein
MEQKQVATHAAGLHAEMVKQLSSWAESTEQYPVDFDKAWNWLGYCRKDVAKRIIEREFKQNEDYYISLIRSAEQTDNRGGRNRQQIMLTQSCFEHFCLKADTPAGRQIRDIFIEIKNKFLRLRDGVLDGKIEVRPAAAAAAVDPQILSNLTAKVDAMTELIVNNQAKDAAMQRMVDMLWHVAHDRVIQPVDDTRHSWFGIYKTGIAYPQYYVIRCMEYNKPASERNMLNTYPDSEQVFSLNHPNANALFQVLKENAADLGLEFDRSGFNLVGGGSTIQAVLAFLRNHDSHRRLTNAGDLPLVRA